MYRSGKEPCPLDKLDTRIDANIILFFLYLQLCVTGVEHGETPQSLILSSTTFVVTDLPSSVAVRLLWL
jgi:hypothetical protein